MCQTPITTGWPIKGTNRCPVDPPVRHSVWSLSDTLSCLERGKCEDFCQLAFSGACRKVRCFNLSSRGGAAAGISVFLPASIFCIPMNSPSRSRHWSFPPKGSVRLTCLNRVLLPTAIEIAIAEVKLTRNLLIPLCFGLARADSHKLPACLSLTQLRFRYESGLRS